MRASPTTDERAFGAGDVDSGPRPALRGERHARAHEQASQARRAFVVGVRARVLISFLLLLIASTAISLLVLRSVLLSRIGNEVQSSLTEQAETLRKVADSTAQKKGNEQARDLTFIYDSFLRQERAPQDGLMLTFVGGDLYKAKPAKAAPPGLLDELAPFATTKTPQSGEVETRAGPARYIAVPISSGGASGTLVIGKKLASERDQVESAIRIAFAVSVVVMLLASLFIWLAASRAMAPLHRLAAATQKITETDLSERVKVRGRDEIADLGRTFNGMLDRLEAAFADQKEFLADVGHELRTPITVIRGHLETLGDDPAERAEATGVINDELLRMSRLVDDLLMLARAGRPDFLHLEPLDLDLLTQDLFAKARALGERRWELDSVGVGIISGDPHRLASAVMNLAQNAVRHTTPGETISIGSSIEGTEARIWVRDEGPGINPDEQERIFERFAHADEAPAGGAGLGLAIVSAIAEAHGGRIELESKPGLGATFSLVLPIDGPAPEEEGTEWHES